MLVVPRLRATLFERIGLIAAGGTLFAVLLAEVAFVGWLWFLAERPW
jgi:hypothetical protein